MNEHKKAFYANQAQSIIHKLNARKMDGYYCDNMEEAKKRIGTLPKKHPFDVKYNEEVQNVDWESCDEVLNKDAIRNKLLEQW